MTALLRVYLEATLWPDLTEDRWAAKLRSALWSLRCHGRLPVTASSGRLRLAPDVLVNYRITTTWAHLVQANPGEVILPYRGYRNAVHAEDQVVTSPLVRGAILEDQTTVVAAKLDRRSQYAVRGSTS